MDKLISVWILGVLILLAAGCQAQTQTNNKSGNTLFTPAQGFPLNIGSRPNDLAVADLNKDGRLDIVTCNSADTVTILLSDGRGGFTPAPGSPVKMAAHLIAIGDVNNDRALDLVLTHHDSFGVEVLLGKGDGRFDTAPGSPFAAHQGTRPHNHGLNLSDLNSDKNLDITTSNQDDNSVSVLLGNGKGNFTPAAGSPFAVGRSPYPHAIGDLNMDGHLDIVTPNVSSNNVSVLLGDGRGGFVAAPGSPYAVANRPYYITIGDISGDNNPDLVATHDDIDLITTLLGNGRGGFVAAPESPYNLGRRAYKLIAADIIGNARMEVVIGTEASDSIVMLVGNERGGYQQAAGSPYRAGANPRVAVGDMNNDGKPDIVTANNGSGDITVLLHK